MFFAQPLTFLGPRFWTLDPDFTFQFFRNLLSPSKPGFIWLTYLSKKCRYFAKGECNFSAEECWYIHGDTSNVDTDDIDDLNTFECFICKNMFSSKYDLMEHKKKHHSNKSLCLKFQKGTCERSAKGVDMFTPELPQQQKPLPKNPLYQPNPCQRCGNRIFCQVP